MKFVRSVPNGIYPEGKNPGVEGGQSRNFNEIENMTDENDFPWCLRV